MKAISLLSLSRSSSWLKDLCVVLAGSILISLAAPISIKLPFTPVPLALAPHLCLAVGLILGKNRAALAVLTYLFQGAIGLPVFALGSAGIIHLLGPSGGYLIGYVAAAYLVGFLTERERTPVRVLTALVLGNAAIYLLGAAQLSLFVGLKSAITLGILPFLIGDTLKTLAIYTTHRKLL